METHKNYFLVGLFVIITVVGALGFSIWLTTKGKGDYAHYRIRFAESVSGLSAGGPVKFRGVDVGNVMQMEIDPQDNRLIRVDVRILTSTPLKADTVASLKLQGITGVVYVELSGGSPNSPKLAQAGLGQEPTEIKAQQSSIDAIVNRLPVLLEKATHIVDEINLVFSDQNITSLSATIQNLQNVTSSLTQQTAQFGQLLQNTNQMISQWNDITRTSKGDIRDMTAHLNHTAQETDALVEDLRKTSRNISSLAQKVEENPSRLIFPEKEKGIKAP